MAYPQSPFQQGPPPGTTYAPQYNSYSTNSFDGPAYAQPHQQQFGQQFGQQLGIPQGYQQAQPAPHQQLIPVENQLYPPGPPQPLRTGSTVSHQSHHSHHSHHSGHSAHSRQSHQSQRDRDLEDGRRRPTIGDTIIAIWDGLKGAFDRRK